MTLDQIPSGSRIFIDSTVFIYHFTASSPACRKLLERCEAGDVRGLTSTAVLAEVTHRLMMSEAVAGRLVTSGNIVKKLHARPEIVRQLHLYDEQVQRIPLMGVQVVSRDLGTLIRSAEVRRQDGLLVNDSLVVAGTRETGADGLASADGDFRRVKDLKVFTPDDLG